MYSTEIAPVALFVFNRPELTARVFERVRQARPSRLLLVADGPRASRPDDVRLCNETRRALSCVDWPCEVLTNFSEANMGCKRRVSSGLDWVFEQCSEAIILEDDCLPSLSFFEFCSEMLTRYRDDRRVMHVSGDNFQGQSQRGTGSYFFSRYTFSWGWATWRRAWTHYDVAIASWPKAYQERWLESLFDNPREVRHWEETFRNLYLGKIDTWDYQWLYTCWRQGGLSIHPNRNLVTNIGIGPDATHFREGDSTVGIPSHELTEYIHPDAVLRDLEADRFMFDEYVDRSKEVKGANWAETVRNKLALRTRMRRLVPRSFQYRHAK